MVPKDRERFAWSHGGWLDNGRNKLGTSFALQSILGRKVLILISLRERPESNGVDSQRFKMRETKSERSTKEGNGWTLTRLGL